MLLRSGVAEDLSLSLSVAIYIIEEALGAIKFVSSISD